MNYKTLASILCTAVLMTGTGFASESVPSESLSLKSETVSALEYEGGICTFTTHDLLIKKVGQTDENTLGGAKKTDEGFIMVFIQSETNDFHAPLYEPCVQLLKAMGFTDSLWTQDSNSVDFEHIRAFGQNNDNIGENHTYRKGQLVLSFLFIGKPGTAIYQEYNTLVESIRFTDNVIDLEGSSSASEPKIQIAEPVREEIEATFEQAVVQIVNDEQIFNPILEAIAEVEVNEQVAQQSEELPVSEEPIVSETGPVVEVIESIDESNLNEAAE